ncbi:hypothetical protein [Nitrobacter sp.]|uniref:hypothetical protein n=1 Tax=unclassified Nitrobacter TaxID=2620411 RepID=UPI002CFE343E|nr:hypothetical protein [Hyphomicrobium sp.]
MNDFREWRSSTREYNGAPNMSKRRKNVYVIVGALLLVAFFVGLVVIKHLGI